MQEKSFKKLLEREIKNFFQVKQSTRLWHIPVLATMCVGIPLLVGLYFDNLKSGLLTSLAGLVMLYMPASNSIVNRMITLFICSFGFMISCFVGLFFSFNPLVSIIVFGIFSSIVFSINLYFKTKPPASFFFILVAALAGGMPYNIKSIPEKVGLVALGTMLACTLALIYSLITKKKQEKKEGNLLPELQAKDKSSIIIESLTIGFFMFSSTLFGHLLKLQNPYWIPISCLAVMQGATLYHIWERVFHRILGTFLGLGLCWGVLSIANTPLSICLTIITLQFIIEMLIVRHYALAVIFITPMTILLAEASNPLIQDPNLLIYTRLIDISIGSLIGAVGGWFIHHEKIRFYATNKLRNVKKILEGK